MECSCSSLVFVSFSIFFHEKRDELIKKIFTGIEIHVATTESGTLLKSLGKQSNPNELRQIYQRFMI